jgi:phage-related protein
MLVNSIDIATFKATLLTKDIQTANVVVYDNWLRNALKPLYMGKQEQYKQIKLGLLVEDINDDSALTDISNLVKQLEECTIKIDEINFYYNCLIVNKSNYKKAPGIYTLDVELKSGYAYKPAITETMNHVSSKTINVPGNLATDVIVTVTVPIDTISLTLTGLSEDPIKINNLKANIPVIISGEDDTVLQSGTNKFGDCDIWEFPSLQPGSNTVGVSTANCVVQIQYKPRWI